MKRPPIKRPPRPSIKRPVIKVPKYSKLNQRQPKLTRKRRIDPSMKAVLGYTAAVLKIWTLYKTLYGENIT